MRIKKNRGRGSGQGGCERRIKVFVLKKIGVGVGLGGAVQGECKRRFKVFVKLQKKSSGSWGCHEEVKFL